MVQVVLSLSPCDCLSGSQLWPCSALAVLYVYAIGDNCYLALYYMQMHINKI